MKHLLLTGFLLMSFCTVNAGGPWTLKKGHAYTSINVSYLGYNALFGPDGTNLKLTRPVSEIGIGAFVEYGIVDRLTMSLDLPFRIISTEAVDTSIATPYFPDTLNQGRIIGMNYIGIGAKYRFLDKKIKMAAHLNYEVNTSSVDANSGLRTGPAAHVISPKVSIGASFGKDKFYAYGEVGPRFRFPNLNNQNDSTGQYSHDLDYTAELGYSWNGKTYFAVVVSGRMNLTEGTYDNGSITNVEMDSLGLPISSYTYESDLHNGVSPNRQQYLGYGIKFSQSFGNFALNLGAYIGIGKRVAAAPSLNLGLSYTFKPKEKKDGGS